MMRHLLEKVLVVIALFSMSAYAQQPGDNNQGLFDEFMFNRGNTYRSASGVRDRNTGRTAPIIKLKRNSMTRPIT